ncbi:hypothetical protein RRG08_012719 [Elysia crispata]|uniref:Uncharacterized protein n=1 Tax=Elysia crispata TaxID=231223 RepID=A0AAE1E8X9_9GAST|nr:hypothetical protein RRG08_012719 [Elysia crispata]
MLLTLPKLPKSEKQVKAQVLSSRSTFKLCCLFNTAISYMNILMWSEGGRLSGTQPCLPRGRVLQAQVSLPYSDQPLSNPGLISASSPGTIARHGQHTNIHWVLELPLS